MANFDNMIAASTNSWNIAQSAMNSINAEGSTPAQFAEQLLNAQLKISVATSAEQKASSAIDKAYQAHGQVASK